MRISLAVAGKSGTLSNRMRHSSARGRCRAKTGTLNGVSNLAGYCDSATGGRVAFAFLMTGVGLTTAHRLQDRMAGVLARYTPVNRRVANGGVATMHRMNAPVRALVLSVAVVLAAAAPAAAREAVVRSFDGTRDPRHPPPRAKG